MRPSRETVQSTVDELVARWPMLALDPLALRSALEARLRPHGYDRRDVGALGDVLGAVLARSSFQERPTRALVEAAREVLSRRPVPVSLVGAVAELAAQRGLEALRHAHVEALLAVLDEPAQRAAA